MLRVTGRRVGAAPIEISANVTQVRIEGDSLTLGREHPPLVYEGGRWHHGKLRLSSLRIESSVTVHFEGGESQSRRLGPWSVVRIVGNVILGGDVGEDVIGALLTPSGQWVCYRDEVTWHSIVLMSGSDSNGRDGHFQ